jgi:DNA (cytosine-5)-methyltransferase 1
VEALSFISLFSGAGGLDLGLEQAGWRCVYASDIDEAAIGTLRANRSYRLDRERRALSDAVIERSDIRLVTADEILSKIGAARGDIPLLAGGPPCQSWSSAGHQHGFKDPRGRLFDDFVRLAGGLGVRWLLLENVRGLLTARGPDGRPGSALAYVRERLLGEGFQTAVSLFNAADYGVPQRRVRLFMVGFRAGDPPRFPRTTHAKAVDPAEQKNHGPRWERLYRRYPRSPNMKSNGQAASWRQNWRKSRLAGALKVRASAKPRDRVVTGATSKVPS